MLSMTAPLLPTAHTIQLCTSVPKQQVLRASSIHPSNLLALRVCGPCRVDMSLHATEYTPTALKKAAMRGIIFPGRYKHALLYCAQRASPARASTMTDQTAKRVKCSTASRRPTQLWRQPEAPLQCAHGWAVGEIQHQQAVEPGHFSGWGG
ncbi:hypothetical protein HDV63DRAFT_380402 [Trichoderma sp. SZMC 28014]